MPLTMANIGEKNFIRKITGKDEVRLHLAQLGFVIGSEVCIVSAIGGNLIISIKDTRIAIDKKMATRIII